MKKTDVEGQGRKMQIQVAHAGRVDPVAHHSTVEMRRAIAEWNVPLFGLKNVCLQESHALAAPLSRPARTERSRHKNRPRP